jgi:hypothetical protein
MSLKRVVTYVAVTSVIMGTLVSFTSPADAVHKTREETCRCSASLKFSRPDLQFREGVLTFLPRVDVSVRTRGETSAPAWSLGLNYEGGATFSSHDVTPPADVTFTGSQHIVGGSCGDHRYVFEGLSLSPVLLSGLTRSLVSGGSELDGTVRMRAGFVGCDDDTQQRAFHFTLEELGNLAVRGWRSVR